MEDDTETPIPAQAGRSRARKNVIGRSMHREEYVRLMTAGWSSLTLERYAAYRYGEDIPASTFRSYRKRLKIVKESALAAPGQQFDVDALPDVLATRQELIALQMSRIAIDAKHEREMSKLFGSTRGEIQLLNSLLTDLKTDLQEYGLVGKEAAQVVVGSIPSEADVPRAVSLEAAVGGAEPEQAAELAKVLHMMLPSSPKAASNGHGA